MKPFVLRLLFATALTVEITGLLLTVSVSKGIHKGLTDVIQSANAFSAGELRARAHVSSRDEIGRLGDAYSEMMDYLRATAARAEEWSIPFFRNRCIPM